MKRTSIIIIIVALLLSHCSSRHNKTQVIALQPIGHYDTMQLQFVQDQVHRFFQKPVIVLPERSMPPTFLNTSKGERYSADSIIKWLSLTVNDSIKKVVGLTHEDIYTTIADKNGHIKEPAYKYAVWGIFGLGYRPGRSAVISDYRLHTNDIKKFQHRLRTVVIHEIGHNMGLPHCKESNCIMNDANEKILTVDNSADAYCAACRNKVL